MTRKQAPQTQMGEGTPDADWVDESLTSVAGAGIGDPTRDAVEASLGATVRKGVMWAGLAALIFRMAAVVPAVIVARILSPHDFGVFAVASTAYAIVASMGELGFGVYVSRNAPDVEEVAPTVATLSVITGAVLAVVLFIVAEPFGTMLGSGEAAPAIRIMSILVFMVGLFAVPMATLTREYKQQKLFYANAIAFTPGTAVLIWGAASGFGATAFAWGRVVGTAIVGAISSWYAPQRFGFSIRYLRRLVAFGLPLSGANLLTFVLLNVDFVVVGRQLGATELGEYSLAFNVSSWATALMTGMVAVAVPAIGHAAGQAEALRVTTKRMVQGLCSLSFPICAAVSALAAPLIATVYGSKWDGALPALTVLPIFGALNLLAILLSNILVGLGRPRELFLIQGVWLAVLIPSLVLGVHYDGIRGAAFAHVGTVLLVATPLFLWAFNRSFAIRPATFAGAVWRPLVASALAWVAGRTVASIDMPVAYRLVLGGLAGAAVYCAVAWPLVSPYLRRASAGVSRLARRSEPVEARESEPTA